VHDDYTLVLVLALVHPLTSPMNVLIEAMQSVHWPAVRDIYREGIETGQATFETAVPTWETWHNGHRPDCRLVALIDNQIVGWAALSPVSKREVYKGVAEVSIYIAASARGKGIGKQLMNALVASSEEIGIWTLQSSVFPENEVSIALHQTFGFRIVGERQRIAKLHEEWRNTVLLERRSSITGI
jgi:L-amino acid N-acyltransferase YncA